MTDKRDAEALKELYKRNDLPIPSPKEIDEALQRVEAMQSLKDDLLESWRLHLGLSVKEFNELDMDQVYNDIDNYGIDKLLGNELPVYPPIRHPKDSIFPTEAVNRNIFNWTKHGDIEALKSTHNAYIYYGILFNDENVKIGAELNKLDEIVHRALITLYAASERGGELAFSISTLHKTMAHNKDARLTDNYREKITASIQKMATTLVRIKVDEEIEKTNYKDQLDNPEIIGNLININMLEGYQHGAKTTLIRFVQAPILYDYANKKNQIARIPNQLLDIPKINMSENNLIIVDYLAAQIQYMKWQPRNRHINYEKLYKQIGMENSTKSQKNRIRNTITKYIIPHWKKEGWIKDAKQRTKNRTINSLEIFL